MANSSLVVYKRISPNQYGKRNHKIDTITPHCVVGQCSPETVGAIFANPSVEASSNYSIGPDGRVGCFVDEDCASWCTSNYANDQRAVTIEVASDTFDPYKMTDKAFAALVNLCVDICKRNGIKKLVWSTNKSDRVNHKNGCNLTVHRDYANKSCPGDWLYNRMDELAKQVNAKLGATNKITLKKDASLYKYGYKDVLGGASKVLKKLKKGDKVTWIKDDKWGWSQVKVGDVTGWVMNNLLNKSGLSKFKTYTLSKDNPKALKIVTKDGKKSGRLVTLKGGISYTLYCTIMHGSYKGKSYIGYGEGRYYI